MPTERKIKFKVAEALQPGEHEFVIAADSGFVHQDDLKETHMPKEHFLSEVQRRAESLTKDLKKPEDLLKDEKFFDTFLTTHRDNLIKKLDIKVDPGKQVDVEKIQNEVREKMQRENVEPLQSQITGLSDEISQLRVRDLDAQVAENASRLRIVPDLLPLVKEYVRKQAGWDPDRRQWFIKKEGGKDGEFELSADPKKGGFPYEGITEFMDKLSRDTGKKAWFEAGTQPGPGFRGKNDGGDKRLLTLEQYGKLDPKEQTEWAREFPTEFAALMQEKQSAGERKLFDKSRR